MNIRRKLLIALGVGAISSPFGSFAQKQDKVWRIGFLTPTASDSKPGETSVYATAFMREMQAAGHTFGVDYVMEVHSADGEYERLT